MGWQWNRLEWIVCKQSAFKYSQTLLYRTSTYIDSILHFGPGHKRPKSVGFIEHRCIKLLAISTKQHRLHMSTIVAYMNVRGHRRPAARSANEMRYLLTVTGRPGNRSPTALPPLSPNRHGCCCWF